MVGSIEQFKNQVANQGLARANRWVLVVHPPRGLTASGSVLNRAISKGELKWDLQVPILDELDKIADKLENAANDLGINLNVPTLGYTLGNMGDQMRSLGLYASTCNIPDRSLDVVVNNVYGEMRQQATKHMNTNVTVTYYMSENMRERRFFEQWQDLIFNPQNKKKSYYDDYIGMVEIYKYDANWNKQCEYRFHECWPINIGEVSLNNMEGVLEQALAFQFRYYERIDV